jgi:two-component system response regulator FixJ
MSESPILIYVADDDDGVRRSLEMLFDGAGYRVAAFASGEAMLAGLEAGELPACAVVDVRMGDGMMTGLDVQRTLSAKPGTGFPVIIVTGHGDVPLAVAAMRLGVNNFIEKPYPPDSLLEAVAEAVATVAPRPRELPALTPREKAVLTALVGGLSNKEIARELGISHRTVEVHRASLMTRLGARNLAEAVRMGLAAGLGPGV